MQWSAAERELLCLIGDHVDRQVELQAMYEACRASHAPKLAVATELRLVQSGIARLLKQIDADPAEWLRRCRCVPARRSRPLKAAGGPATRGPG